MLSTNYNLTYVILFTSQRSILGKGLKENELKNLVEHLQETKRKRKNTLSLKPICWNKFEEQIFLLQWLKKRN